MGVEEGESKVRLVVMDREEGCLEVVLYIGKYPHNESNTSKVNVAPYLLPH